MASVKIKELHSGILAGGKTGTVPWKNPPMKNVVGFWVAPSEPADGELVPGAVSFEITKISSKMDTPGHFRIEVTVKNTSTTYWGYVLYASYLG
jgi:hypothetical protein